MRWVKVNNAIILAAGFGSRFVPLSYSTPKGLLEVFGQTMVERQIEQLQEKNITDITIVVGYLKDKFEYLIDKYGVELVYNPEYKIKNNLSSLYCVREKLNNTYILSSDNWIRKNIFHAVEQHSWYSVVYKVGITSEWCVKFNKDQKIKHVAIGGENAYVLCGPVYFSKKFSEKFIPLLEKYYFTSGTEGWYWENVWISHIDEFSLYGNVQGENQIYEFENLEELREFDKSYEIDSRNQIMHYIAKKIEGGIPEKEISNITCLKTGMTNCSFLFTVYGEQYICRIPGKGTEKLISREEEAKNYQAIKGLGLSDEIIDFNIVTGYKISKYYRNSRVADAKNKADVMKCMKIIKKLHQGAISTDHHFDIKERILFYESLCIENNALHFKDYKVIRSNIDELLNEIELSEGEKALCHIDSIPDNFLILESGEIRLIDWEYGGMAEPYIDIAMFGIYSYYNEQEMDELLSIYEEHPVIDMELKKYYIYVALGGFLWSLWTEYKQSLGVDFGVYGMKMYQYSKIYYKKYKELQTKE